MLISVVTPASEQIERRDYFTIGCVQLTNVIRQMKWSEKNWFMKLPAMETN